MSKTASTSSVYCVTELIGTSESSWEDAAKHAVETATKTLRNLRVAEVTKLDLVIVDGKVTAFRARVNVSFKHEEKDQGLGVKRVDIRVVEIMPTFFVRRRWRTSFRSRIYWP